MKLQEIENKVNLLFKNIKRNKINIAEFDEEMHKIYDNAYYDMLEDRISISEYCEIEKIYRWYMDERKKYDY